MTFSDKVQLRAEILGMSAVYRDLEQWKTRVVNLQKQMRAAGEVHMAKGLDTWQTQNKYVSLIQHARAARNTDPAYSAMGAFTNNRDNSAYYNAVKQPQIDATVLSRMSAGRRAMEVTAETATKNFSAAFSRMDKTIVGATRKAGLERAMYSRKELRERLVEEKLHTQKLKAEEDKRTEKLKQEAKERVAAVRGQAKDAFATGFSFHIMQMYLAPMIYAMNRIMTATVRSYADFDKLFADYSAKSEEYARQLSKSDFYQIAAGQTYSLNDAAQTAERFAASGLDVTKNQEALTKALQIGTIAGLSYNDAANGIIRTMQAMHMQVEDTAQITDAMINAANASTAELKDLVGWFEYAASAAYNAGLNVQQLSAMLGILSSTGLPNTGTAIRQMFLQFSKQDIRERFMKQFDWITEESFYDLQSLVEGLRNYVQTSNEQAVAVREVTSLLGGKVTAQTALNNLLTAEPELWNQVTYAVTRTGTTQDLYNKVTNNTADALTRISNSLMLMKAEVGEMIKPMVMVIDKGLNVIVSVTAKLPGAVKGVIGVVIILGAALGTLTMVVLTAVGGLAIMQGITKMLSNDIINLTLSTENYKNTVRGLWSEIMITTGYQKRLTGEVVATTVAMQGQNASVAASNAAWSSRQVLMFGLTGAMVGHMVSSTALQKQMYSEAHTVTMLTSAWIGLAVAKAGAFNPLALVAGAGAAGAYEAMMYSKIEEQRRRDRIASMNASASLSGGTINNYSLNIEKAVVSTDGALMEDFATELQLKR
jgi:TP901 family phage tail tape measure protein